MKRKKNPFVGRLRAAAAATAAELQRDLNLESKNETYRDGAERTACEIDMIEDALLGFYLETLQMQLADPSGVKPILRFAARRSARRGSDQRFATTTKGKFFEWVVQERTRSPHISKHQLAKIYAKNHAGTSYSTLRRYLAESGLEKLGGVD